MKTKKRPVKKTAKKAAYSDYSCGICGAVIEIDQCNCGCAPAAELICCGRKMTKKR